MPTFSLPAYGANSRVSGPGADSASRSLDEGALHSWSAPENPVEGAIKLYMATFRCGKPPPHISVESRLRSCVFI